ncbi:MAG: LacI family DNA-binding transcriptional regulator [Bacteroidales bacterium]|nr:LacI family DNA-binding transcriptional regulator [Bacteroidales bacterium]
MNITIKDVARLSGVSKGTVDRVIHNREGVSRKSREKVQKVIRELGYEPNVYASVLASRKEYEIAVLLPSYKSGEFWELAEPGLDKAAEEASSFNISIERIGYDQYDLESFKAACETVLSAKPAGVVMAPMFKNETAVFASRLQEMGIPYVFIDSKIEQDGYMAYYGLPMYQSGYLCADLLCMGQVPSRVAVVRIIRDKHRQSDPTVTRRAGFLDYMAEHHPDCAIDNVFIEPNQPGQAARALKEYFSTHPDTRHIVMFNSRIHLIVDFLERYGLKGCRVIGFDNLPANISALRKGVVDMLVTQHLEEQAHNAIQSMTDYIVRKKLPLQRDNFMHMDILTRYNAD